MLSSQILDKVDLMPSNDERCNMVTSPLLAEELPSAQKKRPHQAESTTGEPSLKTLKGPSISKSALSSEFTCVYDSKDLPPYVVTKIKRFWIMIARLSPIMISCVVTKLVGNNNITEVKSAGRNKVSISFNNYKKINSLVQFDALKAHQLKTSIPAFKVMKSGETSPLIFSRKQFVKSLLRLLR